MCIRDRSLPHVVHMGTTLSRLAVAAAAGAIAHQRTSSAPKAVITSVTTLAAACILNPSMFGIAPHSVWGHWLAAGEEDPIDVDIPIIDPHHHMWDFSTQPRQPTGDKVPWFLNPSLVKWLMLNKLRASEHGRAMLRTFCPGPWVPFLERWMGAEMHSEMRAHNVLKTVYIECGWFEAGVPAPVSYTHLTLPTKRIVEISVVAVSLKTKRLEM
eukprot:TRINITY_DN745_c0_g1_i2.p1 TRINITY_DN745_c0_g1~~TRINITY_DN745_c0_g1_i2.p1  ORF type:complete len:213 (+),score=33.38 TRINITY_DN745_c0_g1_i2:88-726(+)